MWLWLLVRYDILKTCLNELMNKNIIQPMEHIGMFPAAAVHYQIVAGEYVHDTVSTVCTIGTIGIAFDADNGTIEDLLVEVARLAKVTL